MNTTSLPMPLGIAAGASLISSGAIFGFFYAWIVSTMWGLDAIDPRVAIEAMNAMNQSVRNMAFVPAFLGTPVLLGLTGALAWALAWAYGFTRAALFFAAAALVYIAGAFLPTFLVNIAMNEALFEGGVPAAMNEAEAIWSAYSPRWQAYNQARTGVSLGVFGVAVFGLMTLLRRG